MMNGLVLTMGETMNLPGTEFRAQYARAFLATIKRVRDGFRYLSIRLVFGCLEVDADWVSVGVFLSLLAMQYVEGIN